MHGSSMGKYSLKRARFSSRVRGRMADVQKAVGTRADEFVEFWPAGESVKGEFHCAECGYGVAVCRELPRCPMCGGESWEHTAWSPFGRASLEPL